MRQRRIHQKIHYPKRTEPLDDFLSKYSDKPINNLRARIPEEHPLWQILTDEQRKSLARRTTKRPTT